MIATAREHVIESVEQVHADVAQFAYSPDAGRWPEGRYRVAINRAGRTVATIAFTVAATR